MPLKTARKFAFSYKGEQQLSASLRVATQIADVLKLFSLAAGVGAPAASSFAHGVVRPRLSPTSFSYSGSAIFLPRWIGRVFRKFTSSHIFTRAPISRNFVFRPAWDSTS